MVAEVLGKFSLKGDIDLVSGGGGGGGGLRVHGRRQLRRIGGNK